MRNHHSCIHKMNKAEKSKNNVIRYAKSKAAKQKTNHKKLLSHVMCALRSLRLGDEMSDEMIPSREKALKKITARQRLNQIPDQKDEG